MLRDIAAEADLAPAQAHAYLASFRRIELVEQETGSGRYLLGPAAIKLAMARFRGSEVISAANREAKTLSQDLGVMVAIVVWGPHAPTVIVAHEAAAPLEINIRAGTRFSAIESACGHVFAAFGNVHGVGDPPWRNFPQRHENPTSLSNLKVAFQNAIAQAREQGYSWLEQQIPCRASILPRRPFSRPRFGACHYAGGRRRSNARRERQRTHFSPTIERARRRVRPICGQRRVGQTRGTRDVSSDARGVQSIEVGWRLLEALIAEGGPMMLRNIAKVGGIAPAQAHPYLVSYTKIEPCGARSV